MTDNLVDILEKEIKSAVDSAVQKHVAEFIAQLALDPVWVEKIETLINQNYAQKFSKYLSTVDIDTLIGQHLDRGLDRWQEKLKNNFHTRGIHDLAQDLQLVVEDQQITVACDLKAPKLDIEQSAVIQGTLEVKDLVLRGTINTDNHSWDELVNRTAVKTNELMTDVWRQSLVSDVLEIAKMRGISFNDIIIDGEPLISGQTLNKRITHSEIAHLGVVHDLHTRNYTNLCDTLHVVNARIGINTATPDMAVNVWDQEVSISMGKHSENVGYIGTTRKQGLAIGVDRKPAIEINEEGLTRIRQLRVDRWRLSHSAEVPGHSGTRGDIVFNASPTPGSPFAWVCLGAFQWKPVGNI